MTSCSIFVNDIITDVFKLPLTSDNYIDLGGSRNVFYNCVSRDTKHIGDACAEALKDLMLNEIKNDPAKRNLLFNYFKQFLPVDILAYIEKYPDGTENIITLAISRFTHPNNPNFPKNIEFYYGKDSLNSYKEKNLYIQKVSELYVKTAKYLNNDIGTASILEKKTIETILDNIITQEKIEKRLFQNNYVKIIDLLSFKNIIPETIVITLKNLENISSVKDSVNKSACSADFVELHFSSIRLIVKWFFKDYLDASSEFEKIDFKAKKAFYSDKEKENIKVVSIYELMDMGWNIRDCAKSIIQLSHETVADLNPQHILDIEQLASVISVQPETRRVLLDAQDHVIGYCSFGPYFEKIFFKIKSGNFSANELTPDTIPMLLPGTYNIFFGSTCLKKRYRKTIVFRKLLFSIIELIEKLAIHGVFINEICARAYSNEGRSLCKSLGLKYHIDHVEHGEMYCGSIFDLLNKPLFKDFKILKSLYEQ